MTSTTAGRQKKERSASPRVDQSLGERLAGGVASTWESYLRSDCLLSAAQLKRLGEHKYSAVDTSWLDELCMKRFWEAVVQLYPMWLAPNLITLIGLIVNLITVLSLKNSMKAPTWAYLQAALGLFIYQTLDATDGKQARRTSSSSPLGELFDHGCDSMTQVFVTLNVCYAMSLGEARYLVLVVSVIAVGMFYAAHWSTYCTGHLRFSKFDVTEAQMTVIGVLLATALFGPNFWNWEVFGLKMKYIVVAGSMAVSCYQIAGYVTVILNGGAGKNGSTVAGTSVLFPLLPLLLVIIPFCMIYSKADTGVYDENITLFCLCFGAVGAKYTNRLVIAHMSKSELYLLDWILVAPLLIMINQYYDNHLLGELTMLYVATIYAYVNLLLFCTVVTRQFCEHLNIYCFTLGPRVRTA